jgi:hypothetical protein
MIWNKTSEQICRKGKEIWALKYKKIDYEINKILINSRKYNKSKIFFIILKLTGLAK